MKKLTRIPAYLMIVVLISCSSRHPDRIQDVPPADDKRADSQDSQKFGLFSGDEASGYHSGDLSDLGEKIQRSMQRADPNRAGIDVSYLKFSRNIHLKNLVEGQEIFEEYKRLIAKARFEVLLMTFVWYFDGNFEKSLQEKGQGWDGIDIERDYVTDAVRSIGEGFIKAQDYVKEGEKITVKIMIDEVFWQRIFIQNPVTEVAKSVDYWIQEGLNPEKFDFQLGSLSHKFYGLTHDKFLVVDRKYAVVTGANIQFSNNYGKQRWHDLGVSFLGPAALGLGNIFDLKWHQKARHWTCESLYCSQSGRHPENDLSFLSTEDPDFSLKQGIWVLLAPQSARGYSSEPDSPQNLAWLAALNNARESVYIQSPSINSYLLMDALVEAAVRGVDVRVITSRGFNSQFFRSFFAPILQIGVSNEDAIKKEIYKRIKKLTDANNIEEVKKRIRFRWYSADGNLPVMGNGANAMHSKLLIVDNQIVIMGSGNQDVASWRYFGETNICLDGEKNALDMARRVFLPNWERSVSVSFQ